MNKYSKIAYSLGLAAMMAGCAEYTDTSDFQLPKPSSIANSEYLNEYKPLKSYIDPAAHPNFLLGVCVNANEFAERSGCYALACSNFNQVTVATDMMHGTCVSNTGQYSLNVIQKIANAARLGEIEVYGHALVSNSNQQNAYLDNLVTNAIASLTEDDKIIDDEYDYTKIAQFPFELISGFEPVIANGMLTADMKNKKNKFYLFKDLVSIPGMTYECRIKARCNKASNVPITFGDEDLGTSTMIKIAVGTEWSEITFEMPATGKNLYAMVDPGSLKITMDIEHVLIKHQRELNEEECRQLFSNELERWISGVMEASEGAINQWTLVNDALAPNVDEETGLYPLATKENGTKNHFFWADNLGENYPVAASNLAKKYYSEFGGEGNLKLYATENVYNESTKDLVRAQSLVHWVEKWCAAGASIDGIGTPMHITCSLDATTQQETLNYIGSVLETLAKSGKLVRISELDINLKNAAGATIATADATFEELKAMSDFADKVITTYFSKVPAAQQGGICQWSIFDGSTPVGIWSTENTRKPIYAGIADALSGK